MTLPTSSSIRIRSLYHPTGLKEIALKRRSRMMTDLLEIFPYLVVCRPNVLIIVGAAYGGRDLSLSSFLPSTGI